MAFSEFEIKKYEMVLGAYVESHRPPPHIRDKVDMGFRVQGQSVEIFEIRPCWQDPKDKVEEPVAKATYVKRQLLWKVYWQRADLKWHLYEPVPEVATVEEFLHVIEADEYDCFFG